MSDGDRDRAIALYAIEHEVLDAASTPLAGVRAARALVEDVVLDDWFATTWPHVDVPAVDRRGHGARWSCALAGGELGDHVLLAELTAPAVLHEVAHLCAGPEAGHDDRFVECLLALVRRHLGFHAYGALRSAVTASGRWPIATG